MVCGPPCALNGSDVAQTHVQPVSISSRERGLADCKMVVLHNFVIDLQLLGLAYCPSRCSLMASRITVHEGGSWWWTQLYQDICACGGAYWQIIPSKEYTAASHGEPGPSLVGDTPPIVLGATPVEMADVPMKDF